MKGGDLTPLYELVVKILTCGTRSSWTGFPSIWLEDWCLTQLIHTGTIALYCKGLRGKIPTDSQLGRAILAAW
jgi:hypothetical protein